MELLNNQNKRLLKYFIVIFWAAFLVINWNEISWVFNYKVISGFFSEVFRSEPAKSAVEDKTGPENFEYSEKENGLEIPKIQISVPLIFPESSEEEKVYGLLNYGVVHFPSSVLPGRTGQTIILGHSAPDNWPKIKYDTVFSRLSGLVEGNEVFVYYNHRKYAYLVSKKIFLERGEEIPEELTNSKNVLVLISCWPPGQDLRRIAVEAALKKYGK